MAEKQKKGYKKPKLSKKGTLKKSLVMKELQTMAY
jgi:hypothetical protein